MPDFIGSKEDANGGARDRDFLLSGFFDVESRTALLHFYDVTPSVADSTSETENP